MASSYGYIHGTRQRSGRWQGIDRRYPTEPWCVQLTRNKSSLKLCLLVLMQELAVKVNKFDRSY